MSCGNDSELLVLAPGILRINRPLATLSVKSEWLILEPPG